MNLLKKGLLSLVDTLHAIKDKNLLWQQENHTIKYNLKQQSLLIEQDLAAQLRERSLQLAHEIKLLTTENEAQLTQLKLKHDAQLTMLKTKYQQDIKDYQQYLQSLDELKRSIRQSYPHLPEAVVFTIHHHAKYLLNQMWEAQTLAQKLQQEMQFITFMATVHEDAQAHLTGLTTEKMPENTLRLLQQKEN